ncbi:low temperature requirement protein A [Rugosimonospora acidiphila]|uniref:Low temperature requirement protein A n=1 Tax=Rugosimonospora acidiphila TaxID=556531 RepID=A0ABP9SAT7_9ACTN
MGLRSWLQPKVITDEMHRATLFEIVFDLVFVFALTRVTSFMNQRPTPLTLTQGFIDLLLLWISWLTYAWLHNQARADIGVIRAGTTTAMAAVFVAGLAIPSAWGSTGKITSPLILALAYITLRALHSILYTLAAAGNRRLHITLKLYAVTTVLSWPPLIAGAILGGTTQTVLWATALGIDYLGGYLSTRLSGWPLHSPSHFSERHSLVLIIALGESLISVGAGAGTARPHPDVVVAALLAFLSTVCLWRLYSESAAVVAEQALTRQTGIRRSRMGGNAYSRAHFPLILGIVYIALGIEQVLAELARARLSAGIDARLSWTATAALFGGATLYLLGRVVFLRLTTRTVTPEQLFAPAIALLLLPAARELPSLAALGLFTAFLIALAVYEHSVTPALVSDEGDAITPP